MTEAARAEILNRYQQHSERFERAAETRRRLGLHLVDAGRREVNADPRESAKSTQPTERLSARELGVLELIAHGLTDEQIGQVLVISHFTVKTHLKKLFIKLGANNRAHAVALGVRNDILQLKAA